MPEVPVGDAAREEIYTLYLSDPVQWTPRQLGQKFHLSVIRIEAILRLKHLEKKQAADGYVLQTEFRNKMEELMGVGSAKRLEEDVDLRFRETRTTKPLFTVEQESADENGVMTETTTEKQGDIKKVDDLSVFKRRSDGNYVMCLSGILEPPQQDPEVLESKNPREANRRWKFIIADLDENVPVDERHRQILVRDRDGTLRTVTQDERKLHLTLYPLKPDSQLRSQKTRDLWTV